MSRQVFALVYTLALGGCHAQSSRSAAPPSAKQQACSRAFKLDPAEPAACIARHGANCFESIPDACACAGCSSCMVLESIPVLVSCGR